MSAFYYIKLYHEILDDPKMGRLPDRLYRRAIECFCLAGELRHETLGRLPPVSEIAWKLHLTDQEMLENELDQLARVGILEYRCETPLDGYWFVTNFAKRQEAISGKERTANSRKRNSNAKRNKSVTKRYPYIESDIESESELKLEAEEEKQTSATAADNFPFYNVQLTQETHQEAKARRVLEKVVSPLTQAAIGKIETVEQLVASFGEDKTLDALMLSFSEWCKTKRKNGQGSYNPHNYGWVDWTAAYLSTGYKSWENGNGNGRKDKPEISEEDRILAAQIRAERAASAAAM